MERALDFLAQTDLEVAEWQGAVLRHEYMVEEAQSLAFLSFTEGSVAEKEKRASLEEAVKKARDEYVKAVVKRDTLRARRKRAEHVIEIWKTTPADARAKA